MSIVSDVLFHALMLLAVVATAWRMRRRGRLDPLAALAFLIAAPTLVWLLGEGIFGRTALLAWAVFGYGVLCAAASAVVLWRSSRRAAMAAAAIAVALSAVGVDAFLIEPRWLEVTEVRIRSSKVDRPLRIAILADLQFDSFGDHERETLATTRALQPDLVLFAGDYVQAPEPARTAASQAFHRHLRDTGFDAPLGVFAVRGNVDPVGWRSLFEGLPVVVFGSTRTEVRERFAVTGLAEPDSFDPGTRVAPVDRFHIALGHAPDFAMGDVQADLLVAGHTHGGQVRVPFIGPLFTFSGVPREWAAGVTELDRGRTLIVSRGTGMERGRAPRLRFNCRPQIVVVDVVPLE